VFLQTLDSLGRVTQENTRKRTDAVVLADRIIDERVREFGEWLQARNAVPVIRELRSRAEHDRQIELARARQRLARGDDPLQVIEALSLGLANKLLHPSMQVLKRSTGEEHTRIAKALLGSDPS